jgi:hypothetical protein
VIQTITQTAEVIADMMTENTGRHILDSGGQSGRSWQRNAGMTAKEFAARPTADLHEYGYLNIDLFHYLTDVLHYEAEADAAFQEWAAARPDDGWLQLMEEYAADEELGHEFKFTWNSYNGESALSQVIQFAVYLDSERYLRVLLQIHGGADVRGGYTRPRVFSMPEEYALSIERATVQCTGEQHHAWDWNGGEWSDTEGRYASDFDLYEISEKARASELGYLPCPECGTKLEAWADNCI